MENKVAQRGIIKEHLREALVLTQLSRAAWDFHPERGWRLLVTGSTYQDGPLNAVLYPVDAEDGIWNLGTALWAAR